MLKRSLSLFWNCVVKEFPCNDGIRILSVAIPGQRDIAGQKPSVEEKGYSP